MNFLHESSTDYVFPTGQFFTDDYYSYDQYMYNISNMNTSAPTEYTDFVTSGSNVVQIRTGGSNGIRIIGSNISDTGVQVYPGVPHDGSDKVLNGKFDDWTVGAPDDWSVESNVVFSQESSSMSIGGISYTYALKISSGHATTNNAVFQDFGVVAEDNMYAAVAYRKDNGNEDLYYHIYDVTNLTMVIDRTAFPTSVLSSPDYTMGWLNILFTVPVGCDTIRIGIEYRKETTDPVYIYAVSSKVASESFSSEDVATSTVSNVRNGYTYALHKKNYSMVSSDHMVFLNSESNDSYIRIGRIMTGEVETFSDPLQESFTQSLSPLADSVDLQFGGRLSRTIYNRDILYCEIQESNETADDFMLRFVPSVGLDPMFIDVNDEWFIYGHFSEQNMPVTTYYKSEQIINFSIEEAP